MSWSYHLNGLINLRVMFKMNVSIYFGYEGRIFVLKEMYLNGFWLINEYE